MKTDIAQKFLSSFANRFRRARPGSVLIIVIVLLLLLAILGAAYISTSRGDRLSSAQSVLNAQNDADTQGIADLVASTIVDDLNDNVPYAANTISNNLRYPVYTITTPNPTPPPAAFSTTSAYRNSYLGNFGNAPNYNIGDMVSDANIPPDFYVCGANGTAAGPPGNGWVGTNRWPGVTSNGVIANGGSDAFQPWLADRIPVLNASAVPSWPNITQTLVTTTTGTVISTTAMSILGTPFESPDGQTVPPEAQYIGALPTFLTASGSENLAADGTNVPALTVGGSTVVAADADNDGIADSLLFRIPGAYFDGLTWYAAVRIIDNNSAINVNTAFSRDNDYSLSVSGTVTMATALQNYYGLFQTSVGLWELLNASGDATTPPAQLGKLDGYELGNQAVTNAIPLDESTANVPGGAPNTRTDYQYITLGDALYHGLGRRLANPAIDYSSPTNVYSRYQALPLTDEAALASHFCLKTNNSSGNPQTLIEQLMLASLWTNAQPVGSYDPSGVATWYGQNFTYPTPPAASTFALRPLLVTRNPVSNYVQPVFDATNIGEPINPRMLPWGVGNAYGAFAPQFPVTSASYNHFKGIWNPTTNYQINDIVVYPVSYNAASASNTFTYAAPGSGVAPTPGYSFTFICAYNSGPTNFNTNQPPILAAGNGTANPMSVNVPYWHLQPFTNHPVKANVNTAPFAELFRAFWCVMAGNPATGLNQPPFNNWFGVAVNAPAPWDYNPYDNTFTYPAGTTPPTESSGYLWHQFRSPLRDPTAASGAPPSTPGTAAVVWMDPANVAVLRAAIAAVNTLGLRDQSQDVISRQVPIQVYNSTTSQLTPAPNAWNAEATVFSSAPQPFITEVYATNDTTVGPNGYVGIELYNPYPFQMTLNNWQVAVINRVAGGGYPEMPVNQLSAYPLGNPNAAAINSVVIPPYNYALLENFVQPGDSNTTNGGNAISRPAPIVNGNVPATGPLVGIVHVYVNNLQNVMSGGAPPGSTGGEFVLLRPRRADGTYSNPTVNPPDPFNNYEEGSATAPSYYDLVPVDSYDFTGLAQGGTVIAWSYIRQKPTTTTIPPAANLFLATNGGAYIGNAASGTPRQQVNAQTYPTEVEPSGTAFTTMLPSFGMQFPGPGATTPPYPAFPPIQIYNTNNKPANSPNPVAIDSGGAIVPTNNPQLYPFGLFARNGDMLNIPFIGAYRIRSGSYSLTTGIFTPDTPTSVVELNSLPMDCAFADDGDSALNYPPPGTGTTVPTDDPYENIGRFYPTSARAQQAQTGTPPNVVPPTIPSTDYYFWTRRLFDYLTVQSNDSNYMPNFDPGTRDDNGSPPPPSYFPAPVTQVYNADGAAPDQTNQDTVGVEGLININTAPAEVLSLLPLVTKGDDPNNWQTDCAAVAQAIVTYRNSYGPFMSIFDLDKVPGFQSFNNSATAKIGTANSPATTTTPVVAGSPNTLTSADGLLTPPDTAFPSVTPTATNSLSEDFQSDNAVLNRISNMITTHSDTFTVYVVVEGWQNAILPGQTYKPGNPAPQLKVVRHYAFIADRSGINQDPTTRFLRTLTVPNN